MKITIPKPCHENWGNMPPEEKGRFCSVCSKTVRDFRSSSDEEIMNAFSGPSENICGNFNESQLNRELQYSFVNSLFAKFAVGFILTTGGFVSVSAQQHIKNDTVEIAELKDVVMPEVRKDSIARGRMRLGGGKVINRKDIEPVYVVDGKIIDYKSFSSLDQNSIKDMKIVKGDEATALYGEKAKNGVIVISTKKKIKK
ncbi:MULTISPECIES: hypothetical protein [Chryseobacterium]|jgi:TonB-dependent SusC/RagA subfamily outer membrane receptor|uniref:TonB-dependent receptor plug domain-containing protein n=1 Tax=Chryseobacterium rhizosphaerae TaxID=395937 RepID=A0ABX9IDG4_9FLAO|nr:MULTISPECIES: hypothetical protein [Chryseobacterium]MDC8099584.1 hypothetical protein [Chryseobacterium rhizosphaerae]MDR6548457.1 TonB-dependent SusC/RagA subfamily outer membrane receptor [Chryseobacterium rhizosphaerae]REC69705.1 hypothetical protein DRF57_23045 [Chryseobacterium rhizosphaerae]SMD00344.1 TonB-dependent outer membrane receptor, SusC/RagA subfamily, signature region [Chryseobacterium sp. YR221]